MSNRYIMHGALGFAGWHIGGRVASKFNTEPLIGSFIGAFIGWVVAERVL